MIEKKDFFEEREIAEISSLKCKKVNTARDLVDRILDLDPSSEALILDFTLTPDYYTRDGKLASRRHARDKEAYLKLKQPNSAYAAKKNLKDPVKIREETFLKLRERPEDILALAEHFLKKQALQKGGKLLTLHDNTSTLLNNYNWPGNVRELQNVIERVAILSTSAVILPSELPESILNSAETVTAENGENRPTLEEIEQKYIKDVLLTYNYNYSKVIETLGIGRTTLWRKMKKYGIVNEERNNNK